jgi:hypothetical protein
VSNNRRDDKAKDLAFQGDAGWGVAQSDRRFIKVEDPPGSGLFIEVLRSNSKVKR